MGEVFGLARVEAALKPEFPCKGAAPIVARGAEARSHAKAAEVQPAQLMVMRWRAPFRVRKEKVGDFAQDQRIPLQTLAAQRLFKGFH